MLEGALVPDPGIEIGLAEAPLGSHANSREHAGQREPAQFRVGQQPFHYLIGGQKIRGIVD